jgi:hypothetical protein
MSEQQDYIIDDVDLSDPNLKGWDGIAGPVLPIGEYEVEVVAVDVETTKKGDGRNLVMTHAVKTEGDWYDQEVKQWLKIAGPNDKLGVKKRMAHVVRDVLGVPLLPGGGFETKHLIGRRMIINIIHDQLIKIDFDPVTNQELKKPVINSKIQGERAVVGGGPAPAALPSNARPAAAPASQAARRPASAPPAPARAPGR